MKKFSFAVALGLFFLSLLPASGLARDHDNHGHGGHWHGDIHHFNDRDMGRWRHGNWHHGFHNGRNGWWWTVGADWYFYPAAIYPYPNPYVPPVVMVQPAPIVATPPQYVYYCPRPAGYYPYVAECLRPWQAVAASEPVQPTVVAQQPALPPLSPTPPQQPLSQRDQDDRQLDNFAVAFSKIDAHTPHAASKLKDLHNRVETYRQTLFQRNYNAMDIMKDTEDLERRIAEQQTSLAK